MWKINAVAATLVTMVTTPVCAASAVSAAPLTSVAAGRQATAVDCKTPPNGATPVLSSTTSHVVCGSLVRPVSAAQSNLLFAAAYRTSSNEVARVTSWQVEQEPEAHGVGSAVATDRISEVTGAQVPLGEGDGPTGAMRVELRPFSTTGPASGDVQLGSGYEANRAEVYARIPQTPSSVAPEAWPDPVGSVRYYRFSVYLPGDFGFTDDMKWLSLAQWKGYRGGSPPIALEIKRHSFRIGGERGNSGLLPNAGRLGEAVPGRWNDFVIGMKLSPNSRQGWLEVSVNGEVAMPRTAVATMDWSSAAKTAADPIYFKEGLYRDTNWQVTHVVYYGPTLISSTPPSSADLPIDRTVQTLQ